MTTVMIYGLILMIARLMMRIGMLLIVFWGVVRLIDRWRFAPAPAAPAAPVAPAAPENVPATPSEVTAAPVTTEVKE